MAAIFEIIGNLLKLLLIFFDPNKQRRREQLAIWNQFQDLQKQYRQALADGKPQLSAQIAKEMQDMRDKYKFLGTLKDGGSK